MRKEYSVAKWKQNTSNTVTSRVSQILHRSSTSISCWSAHLLAGEPMITLWIRMPCVTSGKDGSLNFNSAMMLKQKDKTGIHPVLAKWCKLGCKCAGLRCTAEVSDCNVFTSASASASLHRRIAALSLTHQTKNLEVDAQKQNVWKWWCELLQRIWTTDRCKGFGS